MDTDEIFKHQESEPGFSIEKRNRRSSILKPRKSVICPIDESNTEVFTSGKSSRRVSFANINFIKPFASDPEKTTIWDNTYEEEVNHSDTTKSVDTVCPGLLNVTSIGFPEFEDKESVGAAPFQIWESSSSSKYIHYEIAPGVKECDKENVIPLVKTIVSKNETIIFERTDSDIEFTGSYANVDFKVPRSIVDFVKNRPSQNKSVASNQTDFDMEFTCSFPNTEVVNRAESPRETISKPPNADKNETVCSTDDMEFTLATDNSFSNNMEFTSVVGDVKSLSNNEPCSNNKENDFRQLSKNNPSGRMGFAEAEQFEMEFTTNLCDVTQGIRNQKVDHSIPEAEMDFTCNITNFKQFSACDQPTTKEKIQPVVRNDSEDADMEFTTNLAVPQYFSGTTTLSKQPIVDNGSDDQMEYTTNLPNIKQIYGRLNFTNEYPSDHSMPKPQQPVVSKIIQAPTENISEEIDMEFTTNLAKAKYFSSGIQTATAKAYQSNQLQENEQQSQIEGSAASNINQAPTENISEEIDMEFTTNLAKAKYFSSGIQTATTKAYQSNENEQQGQIDGSAASIINQAPTENISEEIDMEFTTNLAKSKYFSSGIQTAAAKAYQSNQLQENEQQGQIDGSAASNINQAPTENISEEIDMEFTTNLAKAKYFSSGIQTATPKAYQSNENEQQGQIEGSAASNINQAPTENISEEIDMEFTTNLAKAKYFSSGIQTATAKAYQSNQLQENEQHGQIKGSAGLKSNKQVYNCPEKYKCDQIDMEFTANLANYKQSCNAMPPVMAKITFYNQPLVDDKSEDMECTTIVPNAKQISNNLHDLPSGNTSQGNSTETIKTDLSNNSEGVDMEFTISSADYNQSLISANSCQSLGEVKSEDIKRVNNISKEILSNHTIVEPLSTIPNMHGQAVDGNESRTLSMKFANELTTSKVLGDVQTTTAEVVCLSSSNLTPEQPSGHPVMETSIVRTTVDKNKEKIDFAQQHLSKNTVESRVSDKDIPDEVVELQKHTQIENNGVEFTNREDNNILYSERRNLLLKPDKFLPRNNAATPTTSFTMNFSNMSPCIEDTQQLIHATFSKPESIDVLLTGRSFQMKNINEIKSESTDSNGISQMNDISDNFKKTPLLPGEAVQPANEDDIISNKTCWDLANSSKDIISNETPEILLVDESISIEEEAPKIEEDTSVKMEPDSEVPLESTCDSLDYQNYTIRSNRILNDIKKHLVYIEADPYFEESNRRCEKVCDQYVDSKAWIKSFVENYRLPKINVVDFEDYFKEGSEDSSTSRMSEGLSTDEADGEKRLSMPNLPLPKSLYERVCEAAKRSGKYWRFVKSENDFFYFDGLFGAISFTAHVHPELGIVYSIETLNKLAEESSPLAHYETKVFELKLKHENLLPALGPNFDIFSLLDYVCLCMDEIASFHKEFHLLLDKYGFSHKLTVHRDNRLTFEILHFHFIIWWTITIELSVNNIGCRECISARCNLKEKVKEEDVKQIAENCAKGVTFLRCFIEKVDEYVQRMGRRIAYQRGSSREKYMNY